MSADVRDPETNVAGPSTARRHRRYGAFLLVAAAWNVWLWVTRTWNLVNDPTPRSTGFVAVHAALYGVSFLIAIAIGVVGWRLWRDARGAHQ